MAGVAMEWFGQLGVLGMPLLVCSMVAVGLILERALFFMRTARPASRVSRYLGRAFLHGDVDWAGLPDCPEVEGARVLWRFRADRDLRSDAIAGFVDTRREEFFSHLALLRLIAALAPMLGLLGTVIGMLIAFRAIAGSTGPVHPALLAEGLSQAMWTTVVGLLISAPSLVCAQLFKIAAAKRIAALTRLFDELALHHDETAAAGAVVGLRTDRRVRA